MNDQGLTIHRYAFGKEKIPCVAPQKLALPSIAPKLENFPITAPAKILFPG